MNAIAASERDLIWASARPITGVHCPRARAPAPLSVFLGRKARAESVASQGGVTAVGDRLYWQQGISAPSTPSPTPPGG